MDLILNERSAALAGSIFGLTFAARLVVAYWRGKAELARPGWKLFSMLLPLGLGVCAGLFGFAQGVTWQDRVVYGTLAATAVMVGRGVLKAGGQVAGVLD